MAKDDHNPRLVWGVFLKEERIATLFTNSFLLKLERVFLETGKGHLIIWNYQRKAFPNVQYVHIHTTTKSVFQISNMCIEETAQVSLTVSMQFNWLQCMLRCPCQCPNKTC